MFKQYLVVCVVIISNLNKFTSISAVAVANFRRPISLTTFKPSTLLLPPGFDTQAIPRQPMLYPYAVTPTGLQTKPTIRNIKPITTADWIPLTVNSKSKLSPLPPFISSTRSVPILDERISSDFQYSSSSPASSNDGHIFESIVYGTWKPDPPLQSVAIKKQQQHHNQQQQHIDRRSDDGIYNSSNGLVVDGKFYNKTINRQHGGFIGLIQQKPIKIDRHNLHRYDLVKSLSNSSLAEYRSAQNQRKLKKQGRQKIRQPISKTTEQTAIERSSAADVTTTMTIITTIMPIITKESLEYQKNVIKVNATDPRIMEVVKQINESAEIKYNHKQTSQHSIDMMMTKANANNNDYNFNHDNDVDYKNKLLVIEQLRTTTIPPVPFNVNLQTNSNEDNTKDDSENISATRRSWPLDFINSLSTTTIDAITVERNDLDQPASSATTEYVAPDIPSELSALNIPPSLWPKLPGNITKLGKPYKTKSPAEEPAFCVPITVQEQNIMNTRELIFIERVFCFPLPVSTTVEYSSEEENPEFTTTITTRSSTKAKVQNFHDFVDSNLNLPVTNSARSCFKNRLLSVSFILIINFKIIV